MNLVCKEYVASRRDDSGVLVLSEFAGAARELARALIVNPRDIAGTTAAMARALSLEPREARARMAAMRAAVREHDVFAWSESFVGTLAS
jgi:trehalose-6-phosphate synthase